MQKSTTIQRFITIPIEELQNDHAKLNWGSYTPDQCVLCGKRVGKNPKMIHYLNDGTIVSYGGDDLAESQGFFPVGNECAKKLVIQFTF